MLKESELFTLAADEKVQNAIATLRQDFQQAGKDFEKIIMEDFTALTLLAPAVGVALANKEITLFEELMLNRKARQLSRDYYFIKQDPIVDAMKYLVIHFEAWEGRFYQVISLMIEAILVQHGQTKENMKEQQALENEELMLATPPILTRLIAFLFLDREEDFFESRNVPIYDYKKIWEVGVRLGIDELVVFQRFYETFSVI